MEINLLRRGEDLESDRSGMEGGFFSEGGAGGGDVMVVRGCDWPRHTVSKSCKFVLLNGVSDQMDFWISSRTA